MKRAVLVVLVIGVLLLAGSAVLAVIPVSDGVGCGSLRSPATPQVLPVGGTSSPHAADAQVAIIRGCGDAIDRRRQIATVLGVLGLLTMIGGGIGVAVRMSRSK